MASSIALTKLNTVPRRCTVNSLTSKRSGPTCSAIRTPPTSWRPALCSAAMIVSWIWDGRISVIIGFLTQKFYQHAHGCFPILVTGCLGVPPFAGYVDWPGVESPFALKNPFLPKTDQIGRMRKGARLAFKQRVQRHPCQCRCDLTDIGIVGHDGFFIICV